MRRCADLVRSKAKACLTRSLGNSMYVSSAGLPPREKALPPSTGSSQTASSRPPGAGPTRVAAFDTVVRGLPVIEQETVQLGRGKPGFAVTQLCGRDIMLFETAVGPKLAGHVVPDPEWCVLFAPLWWRGDFLFNGQTARPNDLFLSAGASGYAFVGRDRCVLNIGIRKARIAGAVAALSGLPHAPAELSDRRLTLNSPGGVALRRATAEAMRAVARASPSVFRHPLPPALESDLVSSLAQVLLEQDADLPARDPGRVDPVSIARRARMANCDRDPRPVALSELCARSGVSKAWLHKCFVEVYGVSPMAYLRTHRLSVARERLLDPAKPPRSVKDVSLSLGFMNGGRFAAMYAAIYGEPPAATLSRNPAYPGRIR